MTDWIKHIADHETGYSACGQYVPLDWMFFDLKHARDTVAKDGRLVPCPECMRALNPEGETPSVTPPGNKNTP